MVIGDPASPPKYPMTIACMAWMDKLYTDIALTPTSSEADAPTFLEALIKVFRRKMVAMEAGLLQFQLRIRSCVESLPLPGVCLHQLLLCD